MTKVADDNSDRGEGKEIVYTYTITNTGNVAISGVTVGDAHNGSDPAPTPQGEALAIDASPNGDSTDTSMDGRWDLLSTGDSITFTGR
ncbi:MAG: hypothetical protein AAFQ42_01090 [Pseudomonadota bacterium]